MAYTPDKKILEKYAQVLVNFALNSGEGVKKGEVVRIKSNESAKPLYVEVYKAVTKAGGHVIEAYIPDDDKQYNISKDFYKIASNEQLDFFPDKYLRGLAEEIDHQIVLLSELDKHALDGVDPVKIMRYSKATKPWTDWLTKKENKGKFTWTLALYGTPAMAKEAGLSEQDYWQQIIKACFLDEADPLAKWRQVFAKINTYQSKLNRLGIEKLQVKGEDVDLWIKLGEKRRWVGGMGRNIPSFEIFTSPDWRGTEGWIRFNQPLYRYGTMVTGIELKFKDGLVVEAKAKKNQSVLREMIATENADKVGEFSLTDSRFSRITKFMGETLFDENVGGKFGNTHIAVGRSYHDCYNGDPSKVDKAGWKRLGFNDSAVHTDMISTTDRTVTAHLRDGGTKVIYRDGQFKL